MRLLRSAAVALFLTALAAPSVAAIDPLAPLDPGSRVVARLVEAGGDATRYCEGGVDVMCTDEDWECTWQDPPGPASPGCYYHWGDDYCFVYVQDSDYCYPRECPTTLNLNWILCQGNL